MGPAGHLERGKRAAKECIFLKQYMLHLRPFIKADALPQRLQVFGKLARIQRTKSRV